MRIKFTFQCLVLIASATFWSCGNKADNNNEKSLRNVIVTQARPSGEESAKIYSGTLEDKASVNASFMADGRILKTLVKVGDKVRKGQIIATLDDTDYQIGVNQLKAQYRQMTEEKKRMDEMYARHNVAPNDYEKFVMGYEQLGLQLQGAQNRLNYTALKSPSDGYVSEKFKEPGELVGAGTPIYKITDNSRLTANVDLPIDAYLNRKNISRVSGISPVFGDSEISLGIESFTPDADNNMLYHMKLNLPASYASQLTSGMNIGVKIVYNNSKDEGSLVPSRAVFDQDGKTYVWVFNPADSIIKKTPVSILGPEQGKLIPVSGLNGDEKIVETGVKQLYEGEKVNVVKNSDFGL